MQRTSRAQRFPQGTLLEVDLVRAIAKKAGIVVHATTSPPDLTFAALEALGQPGRTRLQLPTDGLKLAAAAPTTAAGGAA